MKNIILFFLIMPCGYSALAQTSGNNKYTPWVLDLRAGGALMPDFENELQNNFKLGFDAGVSAAYKFNKTFSLKTELLFTQKGKSYSYQTKQSLLSNFNGLLGSFIDTTLIGSVQGFVDDGVYSNYRGYNKLTYLEIPLLAEVNIYKFKLTAGPYIGFLIAAKNKEELKQDIPLLDLLSPGIDSLGFAAFLVKGLISSTFPGYNQTQVTESSETAAFTQLNYGYMIRLSYEIHKNTFLEARYTSALNSYLTDPEQKISLSSFSLGLSYAIGIKKMSAIIP